MQVAITYRCNKDCSYCFINSLQQDYADMSMKDFGSLLSWFEKNDVRSFNITGGEPTMHPKFREFLKMSRDFRLTVFTNCLFDKKLFSGIGPMGFLINYNPREHYTAKEYGLLHENMRYIKASGHRMSLMFNVTEQTRDASHIVEAVRIFAPDKVLMDMIIPNSLKSNEYTLELDKKKMLFLRLYRQVHATGVKLKTTRPLPKCQYEDTGVRYSSRCGAGECIVTVNPDLTIFPCLSLFFKGPKITGLETFDQIRAFYHKTIKKLRHQPYYEKCNECIYYKRNTCQGTCLCHKCSGFEITENRFRLYSQFPVDEISSFLEDVDAGMDRLEKIFGKARMKIYLFKNRDEFLCYTNAHNYPAHVIGLSIGDSYFQVGTMVDSRNLLHELCHIYLRNISDRLPSWIEEGLCEYIAHGNSVHSRFNELRKKKPEFSVDTLKNSKLIELDDSALRENIAYQQAASIIGRYVEKHGIEHTLELAKAGNLKIFK